MDKVPNALAIVALAFGAAPQLVKAQPPATAIRCRRRRNRQIQLT